MYRNYLDITKEDDYYYSRMDSGDLILFKGSGFVSKIIEMYTNSEYSHVGIVLKNPIIAKKYLKCNDKNDIQFDEENKLKDTVRLRGLYLLESGYENFTDIEGDYKYGVQIVPLKKMLSEFSGKIYHRKLISRFSDIGCKICIEYSNIRDKPYDTNLIDLLSLELNIEHPEKVYKSALWNWFKTDHQKMDKFICSGLVAYIYTKIGLMPNNTEWSLCMPKYFTSENRDLVLNGGYLNSEVRIK